MRKQTQKASFSLDDPALQAADQEQIGEADLKELREALDEKELEKLKAARIIEQKINQKAQRKTERKALKKEN